MAIAVDATSYSGFGTTSWSHTCTGSNLVLLVFVDCNATGSEPTGITYNSVALTNVTGVDNASDNDRISVWYLANPATGANTIAVTGGSSPASIAVSYTGAAPSVPDASATTANTAGSTSRTGTVTTVADNAWLVMAVTWNTAGVDTVTAGTATTKRQAASDQRFTVFDSNAAKTPAGNFSLISNSGSSELWADVIVSLAPFIPIAYQFNYDWPNPTLRTRPSDRFGFTASLDLPQFFYVPPRPTFLTEWPNPVRRVNAPAWQQSVTESLVIPRDADYFYGLVWISVDGAERAQGRVGSAGIDFASLSITDELDQTPNTCQFIARGFTPTVGQTVIISLGSAAMRNPERIFAGTILQAQQVYYGTPANTTYEVSCIDWTWQLNQRKVLKQYTGWTATAIAIDLIATYAPTFTVNHVAGLGVIDLISFTNVDLTDALTQLAKRAGGYWYVDYLKDLHFFVSETGSQPTALTASHPSLTDFKITRDLSQWITREISQGGGGNVPTAVSVGETILPLDDANWYQVGGGYVETGAQRLTYTGVSTGGAGALVGPGAAPSAAPGAALAVGSGIEAGAHSYAYTDVTGTGETLPSPVATVTTGSVSGPLANPTTAPSGTLGTLGALSTGAYYYAYTDVDGSGGETLPTSLLGPINAISVADPGANPPIFSALNTNQPAGHLPDGVYKYGYTFVDTNGYETAVSTSVYTASLSGSQYYDVLLTIPTGNSGTSARNVYRTVAGGSQLKFLVQLSGNVPGTGIEDSNQYTLGANAPTSSTFPDLVHLSSIAVGPTGTAKRNIYRTTAGGSQLKLLTTFNDNTTTTVDDGVPDASLGALAPTSNTTSVTANYSQVSLSGIAIGASGTTSRKVYRTAAGGSQLKLLTTIANNTGTTYTDSTADASLGAFAPVSDTSGLTQGTGQVIAGSASLITSGAGPFPSAGWVVIGNGQQFVRYTGISGNNLTGIPASGNGSITAPVGYNTTVTSAPCLTGIPASGVGSILYQIATSTPANLVAIVNDTSGQIQLAALLGNDGIQESYTQDGRIAYTEALARATARIALNNSIRESIAYVVRDPLTASGKTITVSLAAPFSVSASYKIQRVTITQFSASVGLFPTYTAAGSSDKLSFEDELTNIIQARASG